MVLRSSMLILSLCACCCGATWVLPGKGAHAAASGSAFSDDFNRSNSTDLGANWSEPRGDSSISSNQYRGGSNYNFAIYSGTTATGSVQYGKITISTDNYSVQVCRYADSSSPFYALEFEDGSETVYWTRYATAAGSPDVIASTTLSLAGGDIVAMTVTGTGTSTVVRIWKNPTGLALSASDWNGDTTPDVTFTDDPASAVDSGAYVGIGVFGSSPRLDDFFGGSL